MNAAVDVAVAIPLDNAAVVVADVATAVDVGTTATAAGRHLLRLQRGNEVRPGTVGIASDRLFPRTDARNRVVVVGVSRIGVYVSCVQLLWAGWGRWDCHGGVRRGC